MSPSEGAGFVKACQVSDVAVCSAKRVLIGDVPVAVVHTEDGEFFAVSDTCSHENVSLSEGEIDETTIECWLHGSRFDLISGQPTGLPATQPIPVYQVKIDGDQVWVDVDSNAIEEN